MKRRILGDEHPETLLSINNMAKMLHEQGRMTEAEPLFREALTGLRQALGSRHPNTIVSLNNMATVLQAQVGGLTL